MPWSPHKQTMHHFDIIMMSSSYALHQSDESHILRCTWSAHARTSVHWQREGAGTGVRPPGDPTADGYGAFLYDNEVKAKTPTATITLAHSQSLALICMTLNHHPRVTTFPSPNKFKCNTLKWDHLHVSFFFCYIYNLPLWPWLTNGTQDTQAWFLMADEDPADCVRCPQITEGDDYERVLSALQETKDLCSIVLLIRIIQNTLQQTN